MPPRLRNRPAEALATTVRADGKAVQVAAPAVPARDDRCDDLGTVDGQDQGVGITQEQRGQCIRGVDRPMRILGRNPPKGEHCSDLGTIRHTQHHLRHAAMLFHNIFASELCDAKLFDFVR